MRLLILFIPLWLVACSSNKPISAPEPVVTTQDTLSNKMVIVISPPKEDEKVMDSETVRTIVAEFFSTIVTVFTIVKSQ